MLSGVLPQVLIVLGTSASSSAARAQCPAQLHGKLADGDNIAEAPKGESDFHGNEVDEVLWKSEAAWQPAGCVGWSWMQET
jgi:hypothetical protein